jgi:hypothetical protein
MQYYSEAVNDVEHEAWRTLNLDAALEPDDLRTGFNTR